MIRLNASVRKRKEKKKKKALGMLVPCSVANVHGRLTCTEGLGSPNDIYFRNLLICSEAEINPSAYYKLS